MKKTILVLSCLLVLFSCKKDEDLTTVKGAFIFLEDAAVIQGEDFVYGVVIDEKARELAEKVEPMKTERFDMVPVEVQGVVKDNPDEEGWEKIVEIREIVEVSQKPNTSTSRIKINQEANSAGN